MATWTPSTRRWSLLAGAVDSAATNALGAALCRQACDGMRWNGGVLAGLLIGVAWLVAGAVLVAVGRRRRASSTLEGAGSAAVIGIFILVVGVLTLFATLLLAVVPGAP